MADAPGAERALVALCVTVTTSYGVLFYAFPVLAPAIRADTGWSLGALTAAFSGSQVVAGLAGAVVGRWLQARGPRIVMTLSAGAAVPALVAIALAPSLWVFAAGWLAAGAAMAGLFYPPAFAALTAWYGGGRVKALTALTLVAGLASTIFAPLTAVLEHAMGWRGTYLVLAGALAVVVLPLHALALNPAWRQRAPGTRTGRTRTSQVRGVVTSRGFVALAASLSLGAFGVYAVVVNLVPLLQARGLDTATAAWALGIGGLGQVLGRLVYAPLERRTGPVARAVAVLATCAISTALFAAVPGPLVVLLLIALLAGMARGIFTLVQATAVTDRWGTDDYAVLNGILHTPLMLCIALAPWAGAAMAPVLGGFPAVFAVLAALGALGACAALATRDPASTPPT
ncbi:MFS transporter [Murinocardiopsis flavida]|nr:MFS transporter [Murinocardiopsis flavida]